MFQLTNQLPLHHLSHQAPQLHFHEHTIFIPQRLYQCFHCPRITYLTKRLKLHFHEHNYLHPSTPLSMHPPPLNPSYLSKRLCNTSANITIFYPLTFQSKTQLQNYLSQHTYPNPASLYNTKPSPLHSWAPNPNYQAP